MTDPIADMLTRIRNALINRYGSIEIPAWNIKVAIARVIKEEGYIGDYGLIEERNRKVIKRGLNDTPEKETIITEIGRVSKPSCRVYVDKNEMPIVKGGLVIEIVA